MRKLLIAAAALAALAIPASAPAEASHRDGWGVSATVHFGSRDRWRDDRRWRGHSRWRGGWRDDDWRWRGNRGRHRGWRNSCRRWSFDGWGWRCARWR